MRVMDAEDRRYLDALLERHVTITQAMITAMQGGFAELSEAIQASLAELQAEIADQREQIRANTEATWRMLDRFGEGPAPAQG